MPWSLQIPPACQVVLPGDEHTTFEWFAIRSAAVSSSPFPATRRRSHLLAALSCPHASGLLTKRVPVSWRAGALATVPCSDASAVCGTDCARQELHNYLAPAAAATTGTAVATVDPAAAQHSGGGIREQLLNAIGGDLEPVRANQPISEALLQRRRWSHPRHLQP